jgi:L-fucose isomerase-like protein
MKGGNSLPAALEISAALIKRGKRHRIVHGLDNIHAFLKRLVTVIRAIVILRGYQAAVIGGRADWLVADTPDFLGIQHFWGINIKELAFDIQDLDQFGKAGTLSFESVTQQEKGKNHFNHVFAQRFREFLGSIKNQEEKYYKQDDYINSLNIFLLLMQIINQNHLSALSLNCFELTKHNMTACLALAALNDMGLPAACEGDSGAMVSMAVSRAVTGIPGFMANISDIDVKSGEIWLTHCTVAPNLCERFDFNTHFESGLGLAVQGDFKFGVPVTLFRLGGSDLRKYFISGARMLGTLNEPLQCRTKARIMMDSSAAAELMTRPLGNHIIMIPGRHAETLSFLMEYKEMLHD